MCGTAGMFVGCTALIECPRQLLHRVADDSPGDVGASSPSPVPASDTYRSPFRNWHERAAVRSAPRHTLGEEDEGYHYFSPDLVPIARHHLVQELDDRTLEGVLIQHLYRYLDFTAKLESLVVNRTALAIANGSIGFGLPEEMRFDAYKIYCDEAYHTLFSADLARQVERRTGVAPRLPEQPYFLTRLARLLESLPPSERLLARTLFVVVSETLISASLAEVPSSDDVVGAVSRTVRDHAGDEGRHHAYFAMFLTHLWGRLSRPERRSAGRIVPSLIAAFLQPDVPAMHSELVTYGLSEDDARHVVAETYTPQVLSAHMSAMSRQTIRYFESLEAFDDARAREQLHAYGIRVQGSRERSRP